MLEKIYQQPMCAYLDGSGIYLENEYEEQIFAILVKSRSIDEPEAYSQKEYPGRNVTIALYASQNDAFLQFSTLVHELNI